MASAAQIDAFSWWIKQSPNDRRAADIKAKFGVSIQTAEKWLTAFNKELATVAEESKRVHLTEYRKEYEAAQIKTITAIPKLIELVEHNMEKMSEIKKKGEIINPKTLGSTATCLKTVYSLAESASGADVAKSKAKQVDASGSSTAPGLPFHPEIEYAFDAESETLSDGPENSPPSDSPNEKTVSEKDSE